MAYPKRIIRRLLPGLLILITMTISCARLPTELPILPTRTPTPLPAPTPGPPPVSVSYSGDIQPIWDARCNNAFCHGASPGAGAMDLRNPGSYAQLVAITASSACGPDTLRVDADGVSTGNPDTSILVERLEATCSLLMPSGGPALSAADILLVRDWITAGAQNN